MFRPCSKGCQYTLRLLAFVFEKPKQGYFRASEACEQAGVPEAFTRKTLQSLVRSGLLKTHRGPHGGYEVIGNPRDVSFLDIIKSVDGVDTFEGCILGEEGFSDRNPCPFHDSWEKVRVAIVEYLASTNLMYAEQASSSHSPTENGATSLSRGKRKTVR